MPEGEAGVTWCNQEKVLNWLLGHVFNIFRELPKGLVSALPDLGSLQRAGILRMPGNTENKERRAACSCSMREPVVPQTDIRQYKYYKVLKNKWTNFSNWEITHISSEKSHLSQRCQRFLESLPE